MDVTLNSMFHFLTCSKRVAIKTPRFEIAKFGLVAWKSLFIRLQGTEPIPPFTSLRAFLAIHFLLQAV